MLGLIKKKKNAQNKKYACLVLRTLYEYSQIPIVRSNVKNACYI